MPRGRRDAMRRGRRVDEGGARPSPLLLRRAGGGLRPAR